MSRMPTPEGQRPKYRFEVTENRPEDDPRRLAIQMAEALMEHTNHQYDASTFLASSQAERVKATQFQDIIFKLEEREKNPPERISRMDPLAEYDIEMCREEMATYKQRAQELQKESDMHTEEARKSKTEADRLQRLIHQLRQKK